jgi:hypothetical protein
VGLGGIQPGDGGLHEPPQREPGEADRDDPQQHIAERLAGERLQRPALVRGVLRGVERHHDSDRPMTM